MLLSPISIDSSMPNFRIDKTNKSIAEISSKDITITSLIVIDKTRLSDDEELYPTMTEGQPSNHEGVSLQSAVVAQTGDEDE